MAGWYQQCDDKYVYEKKSHSLKTLSEVPSLTENSNEWRRWPEGTTALKWMDYCFEEPEFSGTNSLHTDKCFRQLEMSWTRYLQFDHCSLETWIVLKTIIIYKPLFQRSWSFSYHFVYRCSELKNYQQAFWNGLNFAEEDNSEKIKKKMNFKLKWLKWFYLYSEISTSPLFQTIQVDIKSNLLYNKI